MIYFDNASTSFPKPSDVVSSIAEYLTRYAVNPGRGSYQLVDKVDQMILETRKKLADILGIDDPYKVIFTANATHSLNLVAKGYLKPFDHVLVCSYNHNAVIRSLNALKPNNITYDVFQVDPQGTIDREAFELSIKESTKLVIINHASNVLGVVSRIDPIVQICQKRSIPILLDCTQSLGYVSFDKYKGAFDFIAGTGHKTLLGPTGVGFLYVKNSAILDNVFQGGSAGNHSSSPIHPQMMPFKFEAGTLNATGIAGLYGALSYIQRLSFSLISEKSMGLTRYAWERLREIEEVSLYGNPNVSFKVPIIAFNIDKKIPSQVAFTYDQHGICLRAGLHCAPLVHKNIGTLPSGTLRISLGHYNTIEEIDYFIKITKEKIVSN